MQIIFSPSLLFYFFLEKASFSEIKSFYVKMEWNFTVTIGSLKKTFIIEQFFLIYLRKIGCRESDDYKWIILMHRETKLASRIFFCFFLIQVQVQIFYKHSFNISLSLLFFSKLFVSNIFRKMFSKKEKTSKAYFEII